MIYLQAKVPLGPLWSGQVEKLAGDKLVWSSDTWTAVPERTGGEKQRNLVYMAQKCEYKQETRYERESKLQRIEY